MKALLACVAICVMAHLNPAAGAAGAQATPGVIADPPAIQLGFIEPRSTITRTFRLVNTTSKPVTITAATPTCTCTTVDATGKVIPASGAIEIPMSMKVAASTGVKTAAITFTFDGGVAPVTLSMSGEIAFQVRGVTVDAATGATVPYINAFVDPAAPPGSPATPLSGTVVIGSIDKVPFRIESVLGGPPAYVDFDPSVDAPRAAYRLRYDFSTIPCQQMWPYFVVATDHPKAPVVDMRIRHACTRISPVIPFAEYRANLGAVVAGTAVPFEFELKESSGWRVTGVNSKDPRFSVQLLSQRADAQHAMISMSAQIAPDAQGVILAPVTMTATDPSGGVRSSDFWVYFKVVPATHEPAGTKDQKAGS